jgi:Holliday junction resolvase RusA-like endonuclease
VSLAPVSDAGRALATFSVDGLPVPQGSKNAIHRGGRTLIVERGRAQLGPWRAQVAASAIAALAEPIVGPVTVELHFRLLRPKAHYRTGRHAGELREDAPGYVSTRPDVDKLARAVLDALTGVAFADDGQVAGLVAYKLFSVRAGVDVELRGLP